MTFQIAQKFTELTPPLSLRLKFAKKLASLILKDFQPKFQPRVPKLKELTEEISFLEYKPKISIIMSVYNIDLKYLKLAVESVKNQLYSNWELCICDDGSKRSEIRKYLSNISNEEKIKVIFSERNEGISQASNKALSLTTGEFVMLLDHDDELSKNACYEVVKLLNEDNGLDFIYSDEDKITTNGEHVEPFFKPDWSPDLLLSYCYPIHVSVFRKTILESIGPFRKEYDGSQDYDLILRVTEKTSKIGHIPKILYSWRQVKGSAAFDVEEKKYAHIAAKNALIDAVRRRNLDANITDGKWKGTFRIRYNIIGNPKISIIIPSKEIRYLETCIESIIKKSTYKNFEIIVLDSSSNDKIEKFCTTHENIEHFVVDSSRFNFSRINNEGAKRSKGEYLIFLNDDTKVITSSWIECLLEHAQRKEVAVCGAKLLYKNNTVQHAGTIIGIQGYAGNYGGFSDIDHGYFSAASVIRNCSAVTAACMMMKKSTFEMLNGFDEKLANSWQDVDLCLRALKLGKLVVYTPYPMLYHFEGSTRGKVDVSEEELSAKMLFKAKNKKRFLEGDPYYNPNLSLIVPYEF